MLLNKKKLICLFFSLHYNYKYYSLKTMCYAILLHKSHLKKNRNPLR